MTSTWFIIGTRVIVASPDGSRLKFYLYPCGHLGWWYKDLQQWLRTGELAWGLPSYPRYTCSVCGTVAIEPDSPANCQFLYPHGRS